MTFHCLRHTAAAFMIDDGADPLQLKRRMGHQDIRPAICSRSARMPSWTRSIDAEEPPWHRVEVVTFW